MSRSPVVIAAITSLYLLNAFQIGSQWVWTAKFVSLTGSSSQVAYLYANAGPNWMYLISNINASLIATVADSLLVSVSLHSCILSNHVDRYGGATMSGTARSAYY